MVAIEVDIEIYCNTCGSGLCFETIGVLGKTRSEPQFRVNVCPTCMDKKYTEIRDLKWRIAELEEELL